MRAPRLVPAGFFVLRSPLLPDSFERAEGGESLQERVDEVFDAFGHGVAHHALAFASRSLAARFGASSAGDRLPLATSAMRYLERMRGRSTPYGLCAGYTLGELTGASTPIELAPASEYQQIVRLDVDAVTHLVRATTLPSEPLVASREILRVPHALRLARRSPDGTFAYVEVARSVELDTVIEAARTAATRATLAATLSSVTEDESSRAAFVDALVEHGLLVPARLPALTTDDELAAIAGTPIADVADRARRQNITDDARAAVEALEQATRELLNPVDGRSIIIDLVKPAVAGGLGEGVIRELATLYAVLERLDRPRRDERFEQLAAYLERRYEGRDAPLVEALDPDRGFEFPAAPTWRVEDNPAHTEVVHLLYARALRSGSNEVELLDSDLPAEARDRAPRGAIDAFAASLTLTFEDLEPTIWCPAFVPAPGTQLFARAAAFVPGLQKRTESYLRAQASLLPSSLVADVAFFVAGKSAAFVQIPAMQPYEIPLTARPGVPPERELDPNDLVVRAGHRSVAIHSASTGRRVRPRVLGAVSPNHAHIPSIARFLLAQSAESALPAPFGWGPLRGAPFLPRVRFGRHVLSLARWLLSERETSRLRAAADADERFARTQALRVDRGLPRHVLFLESADLALPVDLDDRLSVEAWLAIAKPTMVVSEAIPLDFSFVRSGEGRFHHEVVVPFLPTHALEDPRPPAAIKADADRFDRVPPGGDTLYLKLYGDRHVLLSLVTDVFRNRIVDARERGEITHWFFLPYADPDPHLRLRLFGPRAALWGPLLHDLRELLEPLLSSRILHSVALDTYDRESYRYGGRATMDQVEHIFCASSEAAVLFHDRAPLKEYDEDALVASVVTAQYHLLRATGWDLPRASAQARLAAERFGRTAETSSVRRRAGDLFRRLRTALPKGPWDAHDEAAPWPPRLTARLREGFRALERPGARLESIVADCMHVHTIRMITIWHETENVESLVYLVLERILRGELAFRRSSTPPPGR